MLPSSLEHPCTPASAPGTCSAFGCWSLAPSDLSWNPDSIAYSPCDLGHSHLCPPTCGTGAQRMPTPWGRGRVNERKSGPSGAQCSTQEGFRERDCSKSSPTHQGRCPLPSANSHGVRAAPSSARAPAARSSRPASPGPPLPSPVVVGPPQSNEHY